MTTTSIFIPDGEEAQIEALIEYLYATASKEPSSQDISNNINLAAKDSMQELLKSELPWHSKILKMLVALKSLLFEIDQTDVDQIFTTFVTLIILIPSDVNSDVISQFCEICESFPASIGLKKQLAVLNGLNILIVGLEDKKNKLRVYQAILTCCQSYNFVAQPVTNNKKIAEWLADWGSSESEQQTIWRRLREIHRYLDQKDKAADAMIRLLTSYSDLNAKNAKEDAIQCIVDAVMDPNVFTMDHLLMLKPVQSLEGIPIHSLLNIFVTGSLTKFEEFVEKHSECFQQCKLDIHECREKIRILAFMQLIEGYSEMSYETIMAKLNLNENEIEEFVIEAVRQKAVRCKLNQIRKVVIIYGSVPLSFDRDRYVKLATDLRRWKDGIKAILE